MMNKQEPLGQHCFVFVHIFGVWYHADALNLGELYSNESTEALKALEAHLCKHYDRLDIYEFVLDPARSKKAVDASGSRQEAGARSR